MKIVRVITIGLVFSWMVLQLLYIPFSTYFLAHSPLFAFSNTLGMVNDLFHSLAASTLLVSLCLFSISVGLLMAVFIYSPLEDIISISLKKLSAKSVFHKRQFNPR